MRLIDADAFRHRMYHEVFEKDSEDQRWDSGCWMRYRLFEKVLREQPTVEQPERMRGKWIYGEDEYGIDGYHCNQCGFFVPWDYAHKFINYIEDYHFCPNCGVDMRGEDDE